MPSRLLLVIALPFLAAFNVILGNVVSSQHDGCYTRLFSFGDSIIDNGNWLHYAHAPGAVARPPYGQTFFRRPNGRFCDGMIIIDYIAEALGIPFLTPYLAGNSSKDFEHGANFAVGGATALARNYFRKKKLAVRFTPYSLERQIQWVEKVLQMLNNTSELGWGDLMASSLFLIGEIGGNDYNQPFFQGRPVNEVRTYVPDVINTIGASLIELIKIGARTMVVPGNLLMGCTPGYLTLFQTNDPTQYDSIGCLKWLNDFTLYHNNALRDKLVELSQQYPDVTIVYADYFAVTINFTVDPHKHGFDKPLVACCGGGGPYNSNLMVRCGWKTSTACRDPYASISWDGFYLTDHAYKIIADGVLHGPYAVPLILVKCKH